MAASRLRKKMRAPAKKKLPTLGNRWGSVRIACVCGSPGGPSVCPAGRQRCARASAPSGSALSLSGSRSARWSGALCWRGSAPGRPGWCACRAQRRPAMAAALACMAGTPCTEAGAARRALPRPPAPPQHTVPTPPHPGSTAQTRLPERVLALHYGIPLRLGLRAAVRAEAVCQQLPHRAPLGVAVVGQAQAARADVADCGPSQHAHDLSRAAAVIRDWQHVCDARGERAHLARHAVEGGAAAEHHQARLAVARAGGGVGCTLKATAAAAAAAAGAGCALRRCWGGRQRDAPHVCGRVAGGG